MITPRTRLVAAVALVVVPAAALGGIFPRFLPLSAFCIGALLLLALVDAGLSRHVLAGIRVELPAVVRLQKDHPGTFEVSIFNDRMEKRVVRIGFAFSPEIHGTADDRLVELPATAPLAKITWGCTPAARGSFALERVYLEMRSPLGFWAARVVQRTECELRVYPNLLAERKNVAALFLKRAGAGGHLQRQAGQGREFEKLREYLHGDSIDDIHWKASAKRGHPVTKVFQVERTQEVYVIVDASRLSARPILRAGAASDEPLHASSALERFVTAALILAVAADQQGDQFGLLTFSDKILGFLRAKSGHPHFMACRERLLTVQSQSVTPDFEELCSFIRLKLRKRALLIFLTALDDPLLAASFVKAVELVQRQHLLLVNMLKPEEADPLFSSSDVSRPDDLYRKLGGHLQWQQLRELQKVLQRRGVRFSLLDPAKLSSQLLAQRAEVRARQLV